MELITKRRLCHDLKLFWRMCTNLGYVVLGFGMCVYVPLLIKWLFPYEFGQSCYDFDFWMIAFFSLVAGVLSGIRFGIKPLMRDFRVLRAIWTGHLYVAKLIVVDKSDKDVPQRRLWIGSDDDLFCGVVDVDDAIYRRLHIGDYCYYIANRSDIWRDGRVYPVDGHQLGYSLSVKMGRIVE